MRTDENHVDVFVGATVKVGPNLITYLENHKGKKTLRIVGPDAVGSGLVGDAKPKRRTTGRLIEKRPRIVSMAPTAEMPALRGTTAV